MGKDLKQFLVELRSASKKCLNLKDAESLINKYDAIFSGEKFNIILSTEVRHALQKTYGVEMNHDEFNLALRSACYELDIKLVPLTTDKSSEILSTYCYWVILW